MQAIQNHTDGNVALNIGFIGGAASTIATLASFSRNLRASPVLRHDNIGINVVDPKALNPGPGYSLKSGAFLLNQPAGQEMDFTRDGGPGLPDSFLKWLQNQGFDYTAHDFAPRAFFGRHLLDVADGQRQMLTGKQSLHEIKDKACQIEASHCESLGWSYQVRTRHTSPIRLDGFVLATGHNYEPRLAHPHYLAAYCDEDYEEKLHAIAGQPGEKLFIGSGASMADNIGALEYFGHKGHYRVLSPYGKTCWPYDPGAIAAPDGQIKNLIDCFVRASKNVDNAAGAFRNLLKIASKRNISPQYIISSCLTNARIWDDSKLLKVVKIFYGNPLAPKRFALLSRLKSEGRLSYEIGRARAISVEGDHFHIDKGSTSEAFSGYIVDCAIISRGLRTAHGGYASPLIGQLLSEGIIGESTNFPGTLDPFTAPAQNIFALGPITNSFRNGIETFRVHYHAVAAELTHRLEILAMKRRHILATTSTTSRLSHP